MELKLIFTYRATLPLGQPLPQWGACGGCDPSHGLLHPGVHFSPTLEPAGKNGGLNRGRGSRCGSPGAQREVLGHHLLALGRPLP